MPHFLNAVASGVVNSEPSGVIKHACCRCTRRGQSLQMEKITNENAGCEVQACDKVTTSLSLLNDTQILISYVCSWPVSARPASRQNIDYANA